MATLSNKQLSQLHNAVIKESRTNLTGAVKLYCSLFGKQADLKETLSTLKNNGINITPDVVKAVVDTAKDKNEVIRICSQMLAKVDNTYIKFVSLKKSYSDLAENESKGFDKGDDYLSENAVYGNTYKAFGLSDPINISGDGLECVKYLVTTNETSTTTRFAARLTSFNVSLVAKCVIAYLSREQNDK